eukprot:2481147-Rhodomonas_salina.6
MRARADIEGGGTRRRVARGPGEAVSLSHVVPFGVSEMKRVRGGRYRGAAGGGLDGAAVQGVFCAAQSRP